MAAGRPASRPPASNRPAAAADRPAAACSRKAGSSGGMTWAFLPGRFIGG